MKIDKVKKRKADIYQCISIKINFSNNFSGYNKIKKRIVVIL